MLKAIALFLALLAPAYPEYAKPQLQDLTSQRHAANLTLTIPVDAENGYVSCPTGIIRMKRYKVFVKDASYDATAYLNGNSVVRVQIGGVSIDLDKGNLKELIVKTREYESTEGLCDTLAEPALQETLQAP